MRIDFDAFNDADIYALGHLADALRRDARPKATVGNGASDTLSAPPSPAEVTEVADHATGEPAVEGSSVLVKRVRRTKAQIEADRVAEEAAFAAKQGKLVLTQEQQDAVDDTAGILTATQAAAVADAVAGKADAEITLTTDQVAKIIDLDTLRTALQDYTAKHDMAAGIALLGKYGCRRISEVLGLDEDKRAAFVVECHG